MANMYICILGWSVFTIFLLSAVSCEERKVTTEAWPGCDKSATCMAARKDGKLPNVVYTKSSTKRHDNLHYVFSTKELPTVVMARTTVKDTDVKFNWDILLKNGSSLINGITFSNEQAKVNYKFGLCFTKLIEFNDVDDDADLSDVMTLKDVNTTVRHFSDTEWNPLDEGIIMDNAFNFNTSDDGLLPIKSNNGTLSFAFRTPSGEGRDSAPPSQKYTANETLLDFVLDNFTPSYSKSRFAVEIVAASVGGGKKMDVDTVKTIDDEYSPGVFLLTNWLSDPDKTSTSGFIQWKPVCYIQEDRGRKSSTKVRHYKIADIDTAGDLHVLNATFLSALFGDELYGAKSDLKKMNVSFGQSKDGFYVKNNYTVWTAAVGYGTPPKDEISMTVIIIISAGLGIPVLCFILGGIYTIVRKVRGKKSEYQPISGQQDHSHVN